MITATLTQELIDLSTFVNAVKSDEYGAVVTFAGDVRNNDGGKVVTSLTYEIHPSAASVLEEIVNEVAAKHEVGNVAVAHRFGPIAIGESAFIVAVSSRHRGPAFAACTELVDEVKARLPIWKYQVFADGSDGGSNRLSRRPSGRPAGRLRRDSPAG